MPDHIRSWLCQCYHSRPRHLPAHPIFLQRQYSLPVRLFWICIFTASCPLALCLLCFSQCKRTYRILNYECLHETKLAEASEHLYKGGEGNSFAAFQQAKG